MKKIILLITLLTFCIISAIFADSYIIGTGSASNGLVPFCGINDYSWCKMIVKASELINAGVPVIPGMNTSISGIGFYVNNVTPPYEMNNQRIYMRNTTLSSYTITTGEGGVGYPQPSNFTYVFNGTLTYLQTGWLYITFITPYNWNGTSNIEFLFENRDGSKITSGNPRFNCTEMGNYMTVYKTANGSFPTSGGSRITQRPNIAIIVPSNNPPGSPTLVSPANYATNISINPTFSWSAPTSGGIPTGYKIYYNTTDDFSDIVPITVSIAPTSYTVTTPLLYFTTYYWTVSAYNDAGETFASEIRSFTTRPDPTIVNFPFITDFNVWMPPDWIQLNYLMGGTPVIGGNDWVQDEWLNIPQSSNKAARINMYYVHNAWLVTPPINIPANGYEIKFNLALMQSGSQSTPIIPGYQDDDRLLVLISDYQDMRSPTILREWNNNSSLDVFDSISPIGTTYFIDLSNYTGIKYIAFYAESTMASIGDNDLMIDNVVIREIPTSPILNISPTSINFGQVTQGVPIGPKYIRITNIGGGILTLLPDSSVIRIINDEGSNFSFIFENEVNLGPDQYIDIPIFVNATVEGTISGTLRITYEGIDYDILLSAIGLPPGIVIVGNENSNLHLPIYPSYEYSYSQSIYPSNELNNQNSLIDKIYYYWNGVASATNSNSWTIYMGNTTVSSFASTSSWIPIDQLVRVFSGQISLPAVAGWIEIQLSSPFLYDHTLNLVVAIDENKISYDSSSSYFYCSSSSLNRSLLYYTNDINPDPIKDSFSAKSLINGFPNLKLHFKEIQDLPPVHVNLVNPLNNASDIDPLSIILSWSPNLNMGGLPDFYGVFVGRQTLNLTDEIYEQYFETTQASFNLFAYCDVGYSATWYWAILPYKYINGQYICPNPETVTVFNFTTMTDPTIISPFLESFEEGNTEGSCMIKNWTQANGPHYTGQYWRVNSSQTSYNRAPRTGSFNICLACGGQAWIFRPIHLLQGITYEIKLYARQDATEIDNAKIMVAYGYEPTISGMIYNIIPQTGVSNGDYQILAGTFTPPNSGIYYLGINGWIYVSSNYLSMDDISVNIASIQPQFTIIPDVTEITFPLTPINQTSTQEFTITNMGMGTLHINSIEVSGNYFSLSQDADNYTLEYNQSTTFKVEYMPLTPTMESEFHEGNVAINYEGLNTKSKTTLSSRTIYQINLKGQCIDTRIYPPYTQDFDSVIPPDLPLGWIKYIEPSIDYNYIKTVANKGLHSSNCVELYNYYYTNYNQILITPQIMIPLNQVRLKFSACYSNEGNPSNLIIGTSSTATGNGNFTPIRTISLTNSYSEFTISFASYTGTDQYIYFKHGCNMTRAFIDIDNIHIEQIYNNDLAIKSFSGPNFLNEGNTGTFSVTINNNGSQIQRNFEIQLRNIIDNSILSSLNVNDFILNPDDSATFEISWTPSHSGIYNIDAIVLLEEDQDLTNNNFSPISVVVLPIDAYYPLIGDPQTTNNSIAFPIGFSWKNSLSETIYTSQELQMTGGTIQGIFFYCTSTTGQQNKPIKVWMKNTTASSVENAFLSFSDYVLVANTMITIPVSTQPVGVFIPFSVPFNYTGNNLAVRVNRPMDTGYTYGTYFYYHSLASTDYRTRYMYSDSDEIDPANPGASTGVTQYNINAIPLTMLAVTNATPVVLSAPVVTITTTTTGVQLSWNQVPNAQAYRIYVSDDPYNFPAQTPIVVQEPTRTYQFNTTGVNRKFFKVIAVSTYRNEEGKPDVVNMINPNPVKFETPELEKK